MIVELFITVLVLIIVSHVQKRRRLPGGPFSLPIFGTVDLFTKPMNPIQQFFIQDYTKTPDFCSFFIGPIQTVIIINDFKICKDLFGREEFSGRQKSWFHQNIRGYNGRNLGIINTDGPIWYEQRRFSLTKLRDLGFGRKSLDMSMVQEVDYVIDKLLQAENGIVEIDSTFNVAIINVLWQIVASKRFEPNNPETDHMMAMLNSQFKTGIRKVNFLPQFLRKYAPLGTIERYLIEMKNMMKKLIDEHLETIDFDNPRDFIDIYLTEMKTNPNFDKEHLVVICLDFFQAGAETTSTTLLWAVMFMTLYPKVQKTCQLEILNNLGSRSPSMDDYSNLPYVKATLMEIQRLSKVAPGSLQHILKKDVTFQNYHFKKGTAFVANLTKFLMDPQVFESPNQFKPERFLDENQNLKKYEQFVPFGIGKRICMGETLAKNEMFLFFVRLLQRVTFEETKIRPNIENITTGITRIPNSFEVKVVCN